MKRSAFAALLFLVSLLVRGQDVESWTNAGRAAFGEPEILVVVDALEKQLQTAGGARTVALVLEAGGLAADGAAAGSWSRLSGALDVGPPAVWSCFSSAST
ncbi:MAG: hypothetical protein AAFN41_11460, partial [Planctomycetota bacterium]